MNLDTIANSVFAQLELASGTSAASSESGFVTHGKPGGNTPPRTDAPQVRYGRRYETCQTDESRKVVVREALEELRSIRYAQKGHVLSTKEIRLMIGGDPRPRDTVMYVWRISRRHYYRCKADHREAVSAGVLSAAGR